jgi:hypothetical protein
MSHESRNHAPLEALCAAAMQRNRDVIVEEIDGEIREAGDGEISVSSLSSVIEA